MADIEVGDRVLHWYVDSQQGKPLLQYRTATVTVVHSDEYLTYEVDWTDDEASALGFRTLQEHHQKATQRPAREDRHAYMSGKWTPLV